MTSGPTNDLFAQARTFHLRGDRESAIACIRAILQEDPDNAEAYNNLGLLLCESGDLEGAIGCYQKSIALNPDHAEVYCNYANALLSSGNFPDAARNFEKALDIRKDLYEALLGSGTARQAMGDLAIARTIFCDCLRVRPDDAVAHFRLGNIMREWNMLDLAASCFKNALRSRPGHTRALMNLAETLQSAGEIDESEKLLKDLIARGPEDHLAYSNLLISMNYNPAYSPTRIFGAHVRWGAALERRISPSTEFHYDPDPGRTLRIGYVSSDFCKHPAASFLEPVLKNHDRAKFTVICYSQGNVRDEKTEDFKKSADVWREINGRTDDEVKRIISRDAVDILVDCTGHMSDNRLPLFALKCAPIQITWIGYPNTTGLKSMDYRFTDAIVDPMGDPEPYTEKLVRLANGFCAWTPPSGAPSVSGLPAGKNGFVTFGSLHTMARLNEKVIGLWSRVLLAVPGSRLVIFRNTLDDTIIKRLSSWFSGNGIDLNRTAFQRDVPPQGHLSVYHAIDVALDTFPWSGHTTACEALWMGVPVITLRGDRAAGRMVASILTHAGTPEWIAETQEQYIDLARNFSNDIVGLADIRKGLRNMVQSSILCDGTACAREVEKVLREMWGAWCREHGKNISTDRTYI